MVSQTISRMGIKDGAQHSSKIKETSKIDFSGPRPLESQASGIEIVSPFPSSSSGSFRLFCADLRV